MDIKPQCIVEALKPFAPVRRIVIGYSGGVDSHVLLHLCAALPELRPRVTAVYIHHGLQAVADDWAVHCQRTAEALGVAFMAIPVNARAELGQSPEEAARNARYAAFRALMGTGDVLMFAQHREDQLETVLLQLFRGSGLQGLSGMPDHIGFGAGWLLRPLLDASQQAVLDYAHAHQLQWVEDPSNLSNTYDRNFLRNSIVPLLKQRWPALDKTVARSAGHCQEARQLLSVIAGQQFAAVFDEARQALSIPQLLALPEQAQRLVIRHWYGHLHLKMPSQAFMGRIFAEVIHAQASGNPQLLGQGHCLRRYRDKLYCLPIQAGPLQPSDQPQPAITWADKQAPLLLPDGSYLQGVPAVSGILRSVWQHAEIAVQFRRGGEKITLPKRTGSHCLKKLYQEAAIPPWQRPLMPLLYVNGELAAVGTLWISAQFYQAQGDCIRLLVTPAAPLCPC